MSANGSKIYAYHLGLSGNENGYSGIITSNDNTLFLLGTDAHNVAANSGDIDIVLLKIDIS